ncbi:phosphoribosyltransferase family protein [Noviherbaspirillum sp. CPCC 100848]|uniref:Phosphoribosyltransferase family protein n=1 Tax=Noviherbaspirillum album TaxID=3080276 RepID=A0ABU6J6M5_9BURK|nr:phosphoribosyltransferase family protein [Noviherbaspirillum sp. CPCC 100848]
MRQPPFTDRREAGRHLSAALSFLRHRAPVILGLPRGGVPVAYEIALALQAPLDILLVRKLGSPLSPEIGLGALAEGDPPRQVLNEEMVRRMRPSSLFLAQEIERQARELQRRRRLYCGNREREPLTGRTVVIVDDGIATGGSMLAALEAARAARPERLLLAVPVAPAETLEKLCSLADDAICLQVPDDFRAVSQFYGNFEQTGDDDVTNLLDKAARRGLPALTERNANMPTVSQIMDHDATVVGPHDNVARAAGIMRDWKIGVLPVCDGRRLVGMISDSDIRLGTAREGRSQEELRVAELMSEELAWCFEDESMGAVMRRFGGSMLERIAVLDRDMNLAGMLNIDRSMSDPRVPHDGSEIVRMNRLPSDQANGRF